MKIALALAAAAFVAISSFATAINAQQMDGINCHWAYKKLQQHRTNFTCREDSAASDRPGQGSTATHEAENPTRSEPDLQ